MTDYKELIEHLRNGGGGHFGLKMCYEAADAIEQLVNDRNASVDALKAVVANIDAVPVVRCKDCRSYKYFDDGEHGYRGYCLRTICVENRKENDFCSYGERKGGEE